MNSPLSNIFHDALAESLKAIVMIVIHISCVRLLQHNINISENSESDFCHQFAEKTNKIKKRLICLKTDGPFY